MVEGGNMRRMISPWILLVCCLGAASAADTPNFVVIFCDDLGYGDLACFGHPTIKTPNLDRMAAEGMRFTQFYSACSVCTPSRAALLTGRLPIRNGMCSTKRRVLFPDSAGGIPASEVTLAEALKDQGYQTACVGKWHLGHLPQYLPTSNGFDQYFGIPYSNDMDRLATAPKYRQANFQPRIEYFNVPLMRGQEIIERPADQSTITKRYTSAAIKFIQQHAEDPFFVYLAHSMPHVPLFASSDFVGTSRRGTYGDVVEEIDWSVGQILQTLRDADLSEKTLVFFTSDNGPWLVFDQIGGSAGLLRAGKGSTWEGGQREPTVAWWPGHIPAGKVCQEIGSTMDIYTTCVNLAGGQVPDDRTVDGVDLTPTLLREEPSPRDHMFFYRGQELYAVRLGAFKAHFITQTAYLGESAVKHDPPILHNLEVDPSERFDVAAQHPDVLAAIQELVDEHLSSLRAMPTQLESRISE
jgi:arylsulfatase A-like enzyme